MLSPNAQKLIQDYFKLPFSDVDSVRCPYFNNERKRQRGQLRVLVGKGLPRDIVEEAKIISIQYHHKIFDLEGHCSLCDHEHDKTIITKNLRKFLIDNELGVDCSGFVTNILQAHYQETKNINLARKLPRAYNISFLRKIICFFRPVENIGVRAFASNANTVKIERLADIKPVDVIIMLETGPQNKRSHILLVTEKNNDTIKYVHARAWVSEGKYGHGVAIGEIHLVKPAGGLLEQEWIEFGKIGEQNETYLEAKNAKVLEIRRIK